MCEDAAAIQQVLAGEGRAYGVLLRRHQGRVLRFLRGVLADEHA